MIFKKIKNFFFKTKEEKENFDKVYKINQNTKTENYEVLEKISVIKQLKKK